MAKRNTTPTSQMFGELDQAFEFFNSRLFGGQLPPCMLVPHRHRNAYGYFSPARYADKEAMDHVKKVQAELALEAYGDDEPEYQARIKEAMRGYIDEVALNPDYVSGRPDLENLGTVVHEQCHQWQFHYGKYPKRVYHNRQWAEKMKEIGLYPSRTGQPGGDEVGRTCSHYIIEGGAFDVACKELLSTGFKLTWASYQIVGKRSASGKRITYVCASDCGNKCWAKEDASLFCGDCSDEFDQVEMIPFVKDEDEGADKKKAKKERD